METIKDECQGINWLTGTNKLNEKFQNKARYCVHNNQLVK